MKLASALHVVDALVRADRAAKGVKRVCKVVEASTLVGVARFARNVVETKDLVKEALGLGEG